MWKASASSARDDTSMPTVSSIKKKRMHIESITRMRDAFDHAIVGGVVEAEARAGWLAGWLAARRPEWLAPDVRASNN